MAKSELVTIPNFVLDDNDDDILAWQLRGQRHRQKSSATTSRSTPVVVRATTETYSLDSGRHVSLRPTTPLAGRDGPIVVSEVKHQAGLDSSPKKVHKTFDQTNADASVIGADTAAAKDRGKTSSVGLSSLRPSAAFVTWAATSGKLPSADESSSTADDLVSQLERGKFPPDR